MARFLHQLFHVFAVVSAVYSLHFEFTPPDALLQAGYPAGFRAFIPDFPGCQMFSFHGKLNSPFVGDELGTFHSDVLSPWGGFWTFQDTNTILTPGDILHYWTSVLKDNIPYAKRNLTWTVPDPNDAVDFITPSTLKPPKPTPLKMIDAEEMTTDTNEESTKEEEVATTDDSLPPTLQEVIATVLEIAANKSSPAPTTTTTTQAATTPTTKAPPTTTPSTTTTKKPATSEKPKTTKPKKSAPPMANPLMAEDIEELTTPSLPFDKPIATDFPREPPLFPFPPLFPRPALPPGPGFEICSNPWNFEEQPGESRAQRLERQVAKLQCELAMYQRGTSQLGNTVENEINDLKKLIYGMVGRMARLESLLRTSAFG